MKSVNGLSSTEAMAIADLFTKFQIPYTVSYLLHDAENIVKGETHGYHIWVRGAAFDCPIAAIQLVLKLNSRKPKLIEQILQFINRWS